MHGICARFDIANTQLAILLCFCFLEALSQGWTAPIKSIALTQYFARQFQHPGVPVDCFSQEMSVPCVKGSQKAAWFTSISSSTSAILAFVVSPSIGLASDHIGRKPFLITNQILALPTPFMMMLFILTASGPVWPYYLVRFISDSCRINVLGACIADIMSSDNRANAFGLLVTSLSLGFYLSSSMELCFSVKQNLLLSALCHIVRLLFAIFVLKETHPDSARQHNFTWKLLCNPNKICYIVGRSSFRRRLAILSGLIGFVDNGISEIIYYYLSTTVNFTDKDIAQLSLISGVGAVVAQIFILPALMSHSSKEKGVLGISFVCQSIRYIAFAILVWYPYKWIVFASAVPSSLTVLSYSAITSLISSSSSEFEQGTLQGAIHGVRILCGAAGPMIYASIYAHIQKTHMWTRLVPFILSGFLYLIAIILLCFISEENHLRTGKKQTKKYKIVLDSDDQPNCDIIDPLLQKS